MNKISKIKLITFLTELNKIDKKMYDFLQPDQRYPAQKEGWFFLSYYNVLNVIYYEFCGESEQSYYRQFKSCKYDQKDLPVAWYKGPYSYGDNEHIKGPKGYSCFIPDCINDVILGYKLTPKQKLRLLTRMFNDLKKLKDVHIPKDKSET